MHLLVSSFDMGSCHIAQASFQLEILLFRLPRASKYVSPSPIKILLILLLLIRCLLPFYILNVIHDHIDIYLRLLFFVSEAVFFALLCLRQGPTMLR